ncbi:MAG: glycosyltransferase [Desulfobacteraceae bacterium]|nr:glycosyltransferase [Desulfobacteraceae bacterium]
MRCPVLSQLPAPPRGKSGWPWTEESPQLPDAMPEGHPWPKISIVTPSYNQGRFIEETIRSVLLQGYPNLEYIIMDGGSTDVSVEIIKKYQKWLTYWVSEPDRGQSEAINKGFKKAGGEIYSWLNSDDYLLKSALRNIAVAYDGAPGDGGWFGGCLILNTDGKKQGIRWPIRLDMEGIADWSKNHFGQPACFFSEKAWQKYGPLNEDLHYEMDFDLWLKIAKGLYIVKVNNVLAAIYIHSDAKTVRDTGQFYAEQILIQIRHGYERFAIQDISQWMSEYTGLMRKLDRISRLPFIRPLMPIVRIVWKKLL